MTSRIMLLAVLPLLVSALNADADLFYTHHLDFAGGGSSLGVMETSSATGAVIGSYGLPAPVVDPADPSNDIYTYAVSGAFGRDGTLYTIIHTLGDTAEETSSRLAVVDLASGLATPFGDQIDVSLVGMEIDDHDTIWATGFSEFPLASTPTVGYFGDSNLYRVDSKTGDTFLVGDTGVDRLMDLAFGPNGTLWGTVGNELYTIDTQSGQATFHSDIAGVVEAIPEDDLLPFQDYAEIMGIAFANDTLYGNTFTVDAGLFTIDINNGPTSLASLVGKTGIVLAHGGDLLPNPADVWGGYSFVDTGGAYLAESCPSNSFGV